MSYDYAIIITRHRGLLEWLARNLIPSEHPATITADGTALEWYPLGLEPEDPNFGCYRRISVVSHVSDPESIRNRDVVGILPLSLGAYAASVTEVSMPFLPAEMRGKELAPKEMASFGAHLRRYVVRQIEP